MSLTIAMAESIVSNVTCVVAVRKMNFILKHT